MSQPADYFIAALSSFEQARENRHRRRLEQERHDLYTREADMRLGQMERQQEANTQFEGALAEMGGLLQDTADRISPHTSELNKARGNTGFGNRFAFVPQQDGSVLMGTVDDGNSGVAPLTIDPADMSSSPLRIPADKVKETVGRINQMMRETEGSPEAQQQVIQGQFGLVHDEQGQVFFADEVEQAATEQAAPEPAANTPAAPPVSGGAKPKIAASGRITNPSQLATSPEAMQAAAASDEVKVTERDQKAAERLDENPNLMADMPKHQRAKLAILGLRAGHFTAAQAMNLTQTGYPNLTEQDMIDKGISRRNDQLAYLKGVTEYNNLGRKLALENQLTQARIAQAGATTDYYRTKANPAPNKPTSKDWDELHKRTKGYVSEVIESNPYLEDGEGKTLTNWVMQSFNGYMSSPHGFGPDFFEGRAAAKVVQDTTRHALALRRSSKVNMGGAEFSYAVLNALGEIPESQSVEFTEKVLHPYLRAEAENPSNPAQGPLTADVLIQIAKQNPVGFQHILREEIGWDVDKGKPTHQVRAEERKRDATAEANRNLGSNNNPLGGYGHLIR